MKTRPLTRVLVTRPEGEARLWVEWLVRRGWEALALPLIDIVPAPDPAVGLTSWKHLDTFAAVMFVSGNAVRHFFALRPQGMAWPEATRAWAPGPGTSAALQEAGVPAHVIDAPAPEAGQFDSESLWDRVAGQVRVGERVLIVRGADGADSTGTGRDWLGRQLAGAGVQVESVAVYVRRAPGWSPAQVELARQAAVHGIWLFSSSQAIANLQALLPDQSWAAAKALVTHSRIARAARLAGFGVVCESRPSLAAVAAALESIQ